MIASLTTAGLDHRRDAGETRKRNDIAKRGERRNAETAARLTRVAVRSRTVECQSMWQVDKREAQSTTIVEIRGSPGSGDELVSNLVEGLLGDGSADVILDLRGVTRFSSVFIGSMMHVIVFLYTKGIKRRVPMIVTKEAKETVFKILPPLGGFPWRLFESEADAIEYVRETPR